MKKILTATMLSLILISCGNADNTTEASPKKVSSNDLFLTVSISDGLLKGTHKFFKQKSPAISFVSMGYSDATAKHPHQRDTGKFDSLNLLSEDGGLTLMFLDKRFKGNITKGKHEGVWSPKKSGSKKCGTFMIANTGKKYNFERMHSKNISCNEINLLDFSDWDEGTIYNRRAVSGDFTDHYELEFNDSDGKLVEKVSTDVSVSFNARQQKLKTVNAK